MSWLIWKEYRVNRLIIFVGLGLLLIPHAIALIVALRHPERWKDHFEVSMGFSFYTTQLVFALLGGNAIAGERADRSAEFLATLPFSRWQNLLSKLVLAPLAVVAIWGLNFVVLVLLSGQWPDLREFLSRLESARPEDVRQAFVVFGLFAVTGLTFFCVGWLLSSLLNSPVFSICAGLIAPLAVIMTIAGAIWWLDVETHRPNEFLPAYWYLGVCFTLSVASFITGTVHYLRRVEP
jgi:ABC-type transport system involved in multi-copper enzyme maturation permease subunit